MISTHKIRSLFKSIGASTAPIIKDSDLKEIWMGSAEGMTEGEMSMRWPQRHPLSAISSLSFESPDGVHLDALSKAIELRADAGHCSPCKVTQHYLMASPGGCCKRHLGLDPAEAVHSEPGPESGRAAFQSGTRKIRGHRPLRATARWNSQRYALMPQPGQCVARL